MVQRAKRVLGPALTKAEREKREAHAAMRATFAADRATGVKRGKKEFRKGAIAQRKLLEQKKKPQKPLSPIERLNKALRGGG